MIHAHSSAVGLVSRQQQRDDDDDEHDDGPGGRTIDVAVGARLYEWAPPCRRPFVIVGRFLFVLFVLTFVCNASGRVKLKRTADGEQEMLHFHRDGQAKGAKESLIGAQFVRERESKREIIKK